MADPDRANARSLLDDAATCLRFATRLPVPARPGEDAHAAPDFATAARAMPLAGLTVGLIGGLAMVLAGAAALPAAGVALIGLATSALVTGALHEDGLADVADGFGGGRTRERKLDIMKDSRVGTFGVLALLFAIGLQAAALAGIVAAHGALAGGAAFLAAATLSRAAMLWPMIRLPSARADGASASVGRPSREAGATAAGIAALVAAVILLPSAGIGAMLAALMATIVGGVVMTALAERHIGGQTGDVIGATQQVSQIAILLALAGQTG